MTNKNFEPKQLRIFDENGNPVIGGDVGSTEAPQMRVNNGTIPAEEKKSSTGATQKTSVVKDQPYQPWMGRKDIE